ncbi:hypothetical protein E2C01_069335 [Portunus trituberculatus]|uniref:Uncharacterized protein n=1 Tax=Portunus trituberculatus TaxID=210409 RepID=A0A5B7HU91_PORTR|nr:hypothetical protein [Portunus trituberculatus]
MSAVTRYKQSISHGKERKAHQPSPASAWATPRSVLVCTAYVCLVTPSALGVGLPLRQWNISCFNAHASTLNILHNTRPAHLPGSLRRLPFLATCCHLPYLCLLEEDWPATTPVIPTHDYPGLIRTEKRPRISMDPYEPLGSPVCVSQV